MLYKHGLFDPQAAVTTSQSCSCRHRLGGKKKKKTKPKTTEWQHLKTWTNTPIHHTSSRRGSKCDCREKANNQLAQETSQHLWMFIADILVREHSKLGRWEYPVDHTASPMLLYDLVEHKRGTHSYFPVHPAQQLTRAFSPASIFFWCISLSDVITHFFSLHELLEPEE